MKDKIYEVIDESGYTKARYASLDRALKKAEKSNCIVCVDGVPVDQLSMTDCYDTSGLPDSFN